MSDEKRYVEKLVIFGNPKTKKNSQRIGRMKGGKPFIMQSASYKAYERDFIRQVTGKHKLMIDYPVNVQCVYYRETRRRVDLSNLISATDDCLVAAGVLADDNYKIIKSHDGSRINFDKNNPRVEIMITRMEE